MITRIACLFLVWSLIIGLAGCGQSESDTEAGAAAEAVVGVWQQGRADVYVEFATDGSFRAAESIDRLTAEPFDNGRYEFDGSTFRFISSEDSLLCPDHTGVYSVHFNKLGELQMTRRTEECPNRDSEPIPPFTRILP